MPPSVPKLKPPKLHLRDETHPRRGVVHWHALRLYFHPWPPAISQHNALPKPQASGDGLCESQVGTIEMVAVSGVAQHVAEEEVLVDSQRTGGNIVNLSPPMMPSHRAEQLPSKFQVASAKGRARVPRGSTWTGSVRRSSSSAIPATPDSVVRASGHGVMSTSCTQWQLTEAHLSQVEPDKGRKHNKIAASPSKAGPKRIKRSVN